MTSKVDVKKEVTGAIVSGLEKHRFHSEEGIISVLLDDSFLGSLDLNFVMFRSDGLVELNPIVAVICKPLAALLTLFTEGAERRLSASLTTSLGYLMPDQRYIGWRFDTGDHFEARFAESARLVSAIEQFGLPFMHVNCSMNHLVECLENHRYSSIQRAEYHLPIAYGLLDKIDLAREYIGQRIEGMRTRTDEAAERYRRFSENFCRYEHWKCISSEGDFD